MAATTTFINDMLDDAFTGTFTIKLFTGGLPSGGGTEVVGGSYAAQSLSFSAASNKIKSSAQVTFSDLPTGQTIVSYGVYDSGVLVDENNLSSSFTADATTNELNITYQFRLNA